MTQSQVIIPFCTAFVGWVVGFFSTYYVTGLLERRRAYRSLVSEIEAIRSEFHDYARFEEIHTRSVDSLKPLIFNAIPFLNRKNQEDARALWASFRDAKIDQLEKFGMASRLAELLGDPVMTQHKAMDLYLDRIQCHFQTWP